MEAKVNRPQTRFWLPTWVTLVAVVSVFLVLSGAARLGAAQDVGLCSGDTVLVFTDARLLNADGQNIGGPYALELLAGTYTVTAGSYDGHDGTQSTQPQEQWRVAANSGWLSPFTADIADVAQTSITLFSNQIIPADVSSIELVHLGEGGVNSVSPVCVGFTRVDTGGESGSDTNDSGDDSTDVEGGQTPGSDEPVEPATDTGGSDDGGEPGTDDPDADGGPDPDSGDSGSDDADNPADSADPNDSGDPDTTDSDTDATRTPSDATDTTSDATDTSSTDTDASADSATNTPTDGTATSEDNTSEDNTAGSDNSGDDASVDNTASDDTIEPEVAGIVQEADTLAATGAGPFTGRVLGLGMLLLGIGGLVVLLTERRSHLSG